MSTPNPFDFNAIFNNAASNDFVKQWQDQWQQMMGNAQVPNLDLAVIQDAQKKNLEALAAANKAAADGAQQLMQRQAEMFQQAVAEATETAKSFAASSDPAEAAQKQAELMKDAMEKALANGTEIANMVKNTQEETAKVINDRVEEAMEELKKNLGQS